MILGLGNTILTDDGVGIYIVRAIGKSRKNALVEVEEAAAGGLELLDLLSGYERAILVDAVPLENQPPGTFVRLIPEDLGGGSAMARHQVAFAEALELGRRIGMDLPRSIVIYGIQVADVTTFGETLSPGVAACIPHIAETIWEEAVGLIKGVDALKGSLF